MTKPASAETRPTLSESVLYPRIVDDVRTAALTMAEIAQLTGVEERQVYNWASGAARPKGQKRDRLLEIHYIVQELLDVYTPEGADIWLHGRNRSLGSQRPIDVLLEGDYQGVLAAVERMKTGAM